MRSETMDPCDAVGSRGRLAFCLRCRAVSFAVVISFWTSGIFGLTPDFQFGNYALIFGNPLYGIDPQDAARGIVATLPRADAVVSDRLSLSRYVRPRQGIMTLACSCRSGRATSCARSCGCRSSAPTARSIASPLARRDRSAADWLLYNEGAIYSASFTSTRCS